MFGQQRKKEEPPKEEEMIYGCNILAAHSTAQLQTLGFINSDNYSVWSHVMPGGFSYLVIQHKGNLGQMLLW